jgi:hypothetical protein
VLAAPLGPKVVQDEGSQDVERLPEVGESANVVGVEPGKVVLVLGGGLAEKGEGPGDGDILGCFPFFPYSFERALGALSRRVIQEVVLRGFLNPSITDVAGGRDPHHLQPSVGREALIEG